MFLMHLILVSNQYDSEVSKLFLLEGISRRWNSIVPPVV